MDDRFLIIITLLLWAGYNAQEVHRHIHDTFEPFFERGAF